MRKVVCILATCCSLVVQGCELKGPGGESILAPLKEEKPAVRLEGISKEEATIMPICSQLHCLL